MRPMFKVMLGLLVLILLLFTYSVSQTLKTLAEASRVHHEAIMLPLLVKNASLNYMLEYNRFPPADDNRKFTAALLGDNPRKIPFLHLAPNQLNADGEAIDHWGTPLQIRLMDAAGVQVISAGPDRTFGTQDDIISGPAPDVSAP